METNSRDALVSPKNSNTDRLQLVNGESNTSVADIDTFENSILSSLSNLVLNSDTGGWSTV